LTDKRHAPRAPGAYGGGWGGLERGRTGTRRVTHSLLGKLIWPLNSGILFSPKRENLKQGAEVVDMETSAIFALAAFHGIRAASLRIVSDELSGGKWKPAFSSLQLEDRVKDYFLPLLLIR